MEVYFALKHTSLMLALVGLVIIFYLLSRFFSKRRAIKFGNFETLKKVAGKNFLSYSLIPITLRILAIVLIILSISEPKIVAVSPSAHTDYILAIDTSSSMLTPDISPSRLEATRKTILEFIGENGVGRFGVVTFSGEAKIASPLTNDLANITQTIREINVDDTAGTSIGEALIVSSILLADSKNNKTIILITDGRNNRGIDINKTYESLREKNIAIYSIGIGKELNETLSVPEGLEGLNATASQFPSVDEKELLDVSNITGGKYFRVSEMQELKDAVKGSFNLEKQTFDLQFYLLMAACGMLLLGWGLEITKYRVIP